MEALKGYTWVFLCCTLLTLVTSLEYPRSIAGNLREKKVLALKPGVTALYESI